VEAAFDRFGEQLERRQQHVAFGGAFGSSGFDRTADQRHSRRTLFNNWTRQSHGILVFL
jgi:hypothetical protein